MLPHIACKGNDDTKLSSHCDSWTQLATVTYTGSFYGRCAVRKDVLIVFATFFSQSTVIASGGKCTSRRKYQVAETNTWRAFERTSWEEAEKVPDCGIWKEYYIRIGNNALSIHVYLWYRFWNESVDDTDSSQAPIRCATIHMSWHRRFVGTIQCQ